MNINLKGKLISLKTPIVMGIVNFTEDSFYDGGRYFDEQHLRERVATLITEGVDIIDLGAISTRPGALDLDEVSEIERVKKALQLIVSEFPNVPVSIDTWRASVAEMAIGEGAAMINDISGGTFDEKMIPLIGKMKVPYCLMHTTAKPELMQQCTDYTDILSDILQYFERQIVLLKDAGANDIILDPGFGFGKTLEQNYFIMENLNIFSTFNLPLLVGISRKSMIYKLFDTTPQEALNGTTVLNTIAVQKGAHILRVHDAKETKETLRILQTLKQ